MTVWLSELREILIKLEDVQIQDFGKIGEVVITMDDTMVLRGGGGEHDVTRRVDQIRQQIVDTSSEYEKEGKTCQWSSCP